MPVPTYDKFIEPILRCLAGTLEGAPARDVHDAAADQLGLTESDRQELIPTGQAAYKNRAGWAHDRLKGGLLIEPKAWLLAPHCRGAAVRRTTCGAIIG